MDTIKTQAQALTEFADSQAGHDTALEQAAQAMPMTVDQPQVTEENKPQEPEKPQIEDEALKQRIIDALKTVYDPEIPVNIYDLGLIYDVLIYEDYAIKINMTLTTPGCPVAETFPMTVEQAVRMVDGVEDAEVAIVWDPPWSQNLMSEDAKLALGL